MHEPLTIEAYEYQPPEPKPAGATAGWLVIRCAGRETTAQPIVMVDDGTGAGFIAPTGPGQPVTIVDDVS